MALLWFVMFSTSLLETLLANDNQIKVIEIRLGLSFFSGNKLLGVQLSMKNLLMFMQIIVLVVLGAHI